MILNQSRTRFDAQLDDPDLTLLLLVGARDSKASEIHTLFEAQEWEDWRQCWLVINPSILTPQELTAWFGGETADEFAVVGGAPPKAVAANGSIDQLLRVDGTPSVLKMRSRFAQGDQL